MGSELVNSTSVESAKEVCEVVNSAMSIPRKSRRKASRCRRPTVRPPPPPKASTNPPFDDDNGKISEEHTSSIKQQHTSPTKCGRRIKLNGPSETQSATVANYCSPERGTNSSSAISDNPPLLEPKPMSPVLSPRKYEAVVDSTDTSKHGGVHTYENYPIVFSNDSQEPIRYSIRPTTHHSIITRHYDKQTNSGRNQVACSKMEDAHSNTTQDYKSASIGACKQSDDELIQSKDKNNGQHNLENNVHSNSANNVNNKHLSHMGTNANNFTMSSFSLDYKSPNKEYAHFSGAINGTMSSTPYSVTRNKCLKASRIKYESTIVSLKSGLPIANEEESDNFSRVPTDNLFRNSNGAVATRDTQHIEPKENACTRVANVGGTGYYMMYNANGLGSEPRHLNYVTREQYALENNLQMNEPERDATSKSNTGNACAILGRRLRNSFKKKKCTQWLTSSCCKGY